MVRDLVNHLAVIVGHCDLLSDQLKAESQCARRVSAIQEIAQAMAKELNEYQCRQVESDRSARMRKRGAA
jgi:hypothetical protein